MKNIIITGGRNYDDYVMLEEVLNFLNPDKIIQGGATGADQLANEWANEHNKLSVTYEAKWEEFGKAAGPKRNLLMLKENSDSIVVAFPGGRGTENCIKTAAGLNMIILRVEK